ncbi:hypothetical protein [Deinococcus sp. S9]|uniref:hypothetical protein n=1 Tax=Deinococcus sp. S9 TaxID=2545754 RepID=UPI0010544C2E|nr:hypothetical protein [Deinococcus sp. S9]TDE87345.1 hypothetical protein E0686_02295 [Deinococcus sp. S9]
MIKKELLQQELQAEATRLARMYSHTEIGRHIGLNRSNVSRIAGGRFRSPEYPWGYCASEVRLASLIDACRAVPVRDPALKPKRASTTPQSARKSWETRRATETPPQEREAVFRAIQARVEVLRQTEALSDLAARLLPLVPLGRHPSTLSHTLSEIAAGTFRSRVQGNFLFSHSTAQTVLAALEKLEPVVGPSQSEKSRAAHIARGRFTPPSLDPVPGILLEWAAARVRAWIAGGVHVKALSERLEAAGCKVHQTKLSRLYIHGPVRTDRRDTYLVSPQVAVALVTALVKLGEPPAPLDLVSRQEAAQALGISEERVRILLKQGRLRWVNIANPLGHEPHA